MENKPPFECVALLLQGGGALGSYQAGVYEALAEVNLHPNWVAGISIGAINSALIAGNAPENRVDALKTFWEGITTHSFITPSTINSLTRLYGGDNELLRSWTNQLSGFKTMMQGVPGFFRPRAIPPYLAPNSTPGALSYYDTSPLEDTLNRLVDLWSAKGDYPRDMSSQDVRLKDIRYSSRTRQNTDYFREQQALRRALAHLLEHLPEGTDIVNEEDIRHLIAEADEKVYNIAHLIYRAKGYEGDNKDYEFSRGTMEDHWAAGYEDTVKTLSNPKVLQRPTNPEGLQVFDLNELK